MADVPQSRIKENRGPNVPTRTFPKCFDPYLLYAIHTSFAAFAPAVSDASGSSKGIKPVVSLLVELKPDVNPAEFVKSLRDRRTCDLKESSPAARYLTLRCPTTFLDQDLDAIWDKLVSRVELSLGVSPWPNQGKDANPEGLLLVSFGFDDQSSGSPVEWSHTKVDASGDITALARKGSRPRSKMKTVIGVIDDGCPFANSRFLTESGTSRIHAIWDQNARDPVTYHHANLKHAFGSPVTDFGYGLEYLRTTIRTDSESFDEFLKSIGLADLVPAGTKEAGINDWLQHHKQNGSGVIDEDGCYLDALARFPRKKSGFDTLLHAASHGAHVMDMAAGNAPPSSRHSTDRITPPSWTLPETADDQDIVFVQISQAGIDDASGRWLGTHILDGVGYILSCVGPEAEKVVINISYGPTVGPHDGIAVLERALRKLTQAYGRNGKPSLDIVIAAGNSYLSDAHIQFPRPEQGGPQEWIWRIPPDNPVPCFSEVWMYIKDAELCGPGELGICVELMDPFGKAVTSQYVRAWRSAVCWLLVVPPTRPSENNRAPAPHGNWKIAVSRRVSEEEISAEGHAYVARSDPNMGSKTGAKRSYFVDPAWEKRHEDKFADQSRNRERNNCLVKRDGTLNGIGTGGYLDASKYPLVSVHVAGGYRLIDGKKAPYSSAGPALTGNEAVLKNGRKHQHRLGPDYSFPTDETFSLRGIRGAGNRSGGAFRLVGTSSAAPQLARVIAGLPPLAMPPRVGPKPKEPAIQGGIGKMRPLP